MATAFQPNAFQFGAFQIAPTTREVTWPGVEQHHGPDIGLIRELQRQHREAASAAPRRDARSPEVVMDLDYSQSQQEEEELALLLLLS